MRAAGDCHLQPELYSTLVGSSTTNSHLKRHTQHNILNDQVIGDHNKAEIVAVKVRYETVYETDFSSRTFFMVVLYIQFIQSSYKQKRT